MLAGMAKQIARIVKLLTPKRRWAQFSLTRCAGQRKALTLAKRRTDRWGLTARGLPDTL
jgi:hypothetical protein